MLKYEEIISPNIEELFEYLREGKARSFPVPTLYNGEIRDVYFIYTALRNCGFISPSGRVCVDPIMKKIEWYSNSDEKNFSYKKNTEIKFLSIRTYDEVEKSVELYKTLYPKVRIFAFESELTVEKKDILVKYKSTFDILIDDSQKILYRDISPDFFEWMESHVN